MKRIPRLFSVLIVLILCMTLAVPVFAASNSKSAGSYGVLRGTYTVDTATTELKTVTTVTQNQDGAYLRTTVEFSNGLDSFGEYYDQSARGNVRLSSNFPVPLMGGYPNYVYTCHEVYSGSVGQAYAVRNEGDISFY